ncbi:hypothetical protein SAMD00023353_11500140 [Rosellinia necatrix]|uniref:Uncharacterized protein n=1 Tax=Rosellinia necatrix TaxID=77044 RepID=A0A1W2TX60_ROSNE|nr:hypothetical protein SAMD00023353_11500140 [Rosellinia necatrix]
MFHCPDHALWGVRLSHINDVAWLKADTLIRNLTSGMKYLLDITLYHIHAAIRTGNVVRCLWMPLGFAGPVQPAATGQGRDRDPRKFRGHAKMADWFGYYGVSVVQRRATKEAYLGLFHATTPPARRLWLALVFIPLSVIGFTSSWSPWQHAVAIGNNSNVFRNIIILLVECRYVDVRYFVSLSADQLIDHIPCMVTTIAD